MKLCALASVALTLIVANPAFGHRLNLFAGVEDGQIRGSVYFADDAPAQDVKVTIRGESSGEERVVTTNAEGEFTFDPERRETYTLSADSGDGHYAEFVVTGEELPTSLPAADDQSTPQPAANRDPAAAEVSTAELEQAVDAAVSRHVAPLRRELDRYQQSVRIHDIIGGIGYIVGLAGLWALWKNRSKQGQRP